MIISEYMKTEHRACDELFAKAEGAVIDGNFEEGEKLFTDFSDDTLRHFFKEETALFPTFENVTGMREGPTQMMRQEHEQMRDLISRMSKAIDAKDKDTYLAVAEPLMILMQQHNMKEEQMLYTMCDRSIPVDVKEETIEIMKKIRD